MPRMPLCWQKPGIGSTPERRRAHRRQRARRWHATSRLEMAARSACARACHLPPVGAGDGESSGDRGENGRSSSRVRVLASSREITCAGGVAKRVAENIGARAENVARHRQSAVILSTRCASAEMAAYRAPAPRSRPAGTVAAAARREAAQRALTQKEKASQKKMKCGRPSNAPYNEGNLMPGKSNVRLLRGKSYQGHSRKCAVMWRKREKSPHGASATSIMPVPTSRRSGAALPLEVTILGACTHFAV